MLKSSYRIRKYIIDNYGDYNVLFTTDNTELSKKVIVKGVAIGFFSDLFLEYDSYVLNGDLIPLEIKGHNIVSSIGWVRSKRKFYSRAAQEFVQELQTQMNKDKINQP
jgi:DNA-binding transcriptional LysR family regulator